MGSCDVIDFRCIFVSELAGTALMATLLALTIYFVISSKMNWGFTTTVGFLFPLLLIFGLMMSGFSAIMSFATIILGFMLAWIFNKLMAGR